MRTPTSSDLARRREQAKAGMAVSLGALVATGFFAYAGGRSGTTRALHIGAGVALVGFSYWHWSLYRQQAFAKGRFA